MSIGAAVTSKFPIGNAEIRVGNLDRANKLDSNDSIGLLQSVSVNVSQDSVDLEGGLPKSLIDSAIVKTNVKVSAQAYEFSRKNLRIALNEAEDNSAEVSGLITATTSASATGSSTIDTDIPFASLAIGDMLVIYPDNIPEDLSMVQATAVTDVLGKAQVTIDNTKTPLLFDIKSTDHVYKANQIGLGRSVATNYFTLDALGVDHITGRPTGFKFWKVAIEGGLDYSYSNDNFAVTPLSFKVLQPSIADTLPGNPLEHIANLIADHPYGMQFDGEGSPAQASPGYEFLYDMSGNILSDSSGFIEVLVA